MTLQEMKNIDIRDIDRNKVVDISEVKVNMDLPKEERMMDVIKQMNGNPYFFKVGKILVKTSFLDTDISIEERLEDYLRTI